MNSPSLCPLFQCKSALIFCPTFSERGSVVALCTLKFLILGYVFFEQACEKLIRLPLRKSLLHRLVRGTILQTQSLEKTLPGRDWQLPAAPGQEAFLTLYLTTVRTGTRGNSGFKSVKKYSIPSRKHRKAPQITTKNLVQAFGISCSRNEQIAKRSLISS